MSLAIDEERKSILETCMRDFIADGGDFSDIGFKLIPAPPDGPPPITLLEEVAEEDVPQAEQVEQTVHVPPPPPPCRPQGALPQKQVTNNGRSRAGEMRARAAQELDDMIQGLGIGDIPWKVVDGKIWQKSDQRWQDDDDDDQQRAARQRKHDCMADNGEEDSRRQTRVRGGQHVRLAKQLSYLQSQGQLHVDALGAGAKAYIAWSKQAHATIWRKVTADK